MSPSDLPRGTITFLFTDIEGSTTLLQRLGDAYGQVLADHNRLVREAIRAGGGIEVQMQGDAFYVVFARAKAAVASAVAAQRALRKHAWPEGVSVRVRMGMHTGEPALSPDGYVGLDVHRAARICSAAWGGQILLSQSTRDLVEQDLPEGVTLRNLQRHRLKDLQHTEHLYQVLHAGLPVEFPPLRSLDAPTRNLPRPLTSFVGREREVAEVKRQLTETRLLTLVGPGGAGKTRLALQAAGDLADQFEHGACFVDFAAVTDAAQVPGALASALAVREEPGRPLQATLVAYLRDRHVLMLLDNCEHLIEAVATQVTGLLQAASRLQLLATSREVLGIAGESAFRVPSLSLPDQGAVSAVEALSGYEAIRLFVDRAADVVPGFALTEQNAAAITQICRRLDGIPLAIELAASRVRVLTVDQIAGRLDDRFRLLTGGTRTAMPRQQTLKAAMDWSYDLLSPKEAAVLRRLSAFSGGRTLEAAEAVCADGDVASHEVLDLLTHLVDKSLVIVEDHDQEVRYRLLETVRQYGRDRLLETGEATAVRARHLRWYVEFAERAEPELHGADQLTWLARLDVEHDNFRSALDWALCEGEVDAALRLSLALWWYWSIRGLISEGREWLERSAASASASNVLRARALAGAATMAVFAADLERAAGIGAEALTLAREVADPLATGFALTVLAMSAGARGDYPQATAMGSDAVDVLRAHGLPWHTAAAMAVVGEHALENGEYDRAAGLLEESLALFERSGDRWGVAYATRLLGGLARSRGDYGQAAALHERSLALNRELGHRYGVATTLLNLALVPLSQGEFDRSVALLEESLAQFDRSHDRWGHASALYYLGLTAFYRVDPARAQPLLERSLQLFRDAGFTEGAAEALATLGRLALQQDDAPRAAAMAAEALAMLEGAGSARARAYALRVLAAADLRQGDPAGATARAAESQRLFAGLGVAWAEAWSLVLLGEIALSEGKWSEAGDRLHRSLAIRRTLGDRLGIAECLEGLADVEARIGSARRAARLLGAAEAIRQQIGTPLPAFDRDRHEAALASLRERLPSEASEAAWAEGRALSADAAAAEALAAFQDTRVSLRD